MLQQQNPLSAHSVLIQSVSVSSMSQQAHFWLRVIGVSVILALAFGSRMGLNRAVTPQARMAAVAR
jgi:hypothetical protein